MIGNPEEIHYKPGRRARSLMPGHHAGRLGGVGLELMGHTSLLNAPDIRRFDLLASLRSTDQSLQFCVYSQRTSIDVTVLADLSASMHLGTPISKLGVAGQLAQSLGFSAYRSGDTFAVYGADALLRMEGLLPRLRKPPADRDVKQLFGGEVGGLAGSEGLLEAAGLIGSKPGLVFLASDFQFPRSTLASLLSVLGRHRVVPVIIQDKSERFAPSGYGFFHLKDLESGHRRRLWMRPALSARIQSRLDHRRDELSSWLTARNAPPLLLDNGFSADEVTRYFHA